VPLTAEWHSNHGNYSRTAPPVGENDGLHLEGQISSQILDKAEVAIAAAAPHKYYANRDPRALWVGGVDKYLLRLSLGFLEVRSEGTARKD